MTDFDQLFRDAGRVPLRLAVAAAEETDTLKAVRDAEAEGIIVPFLFGDSEKIREITSAIGFDTSCSTIIDAGTPSEAAAAAVASVRNGETDFIMKGLIDTSLFLKEILNRKTGLPVRNLLSHIAVFDVPHYPRLLFTTDGGMVMYPDLQQKKQLIENALTLTRALRYEKTIVGCLSAKEKVNPEMPSTVDAAELKKMGAAGVFGTDVFVEGPMAMDLVFSMDAVKTKGFNSIAAGNVDVLLFPNIETGNAVGKTLMQIPGTRMIGTVVGASVPIVLTSRADSAIEKYNSIRMAGIIAAGTKKTGILK